MTREHARSHLSQWRDAARDDTELKATEKAVVLVISTYMNGAGICWPSIETIARGASLSERAVRAALAVLERRSFLEIERSAGRTSNRYRIPLTLHTVPGSTLHHGASNPAPGAPESNRKQRGAVQDGRAAGICPDCDVGGGQHAADCEASR